MALENQELTEGQEGPKTPGMEIIAWEVPEYHKHDRGRWWYIIFAVICMGLIIQAIFTGNFLFAVILVIAGFVIIINDARHPAPVSVRITTEGVMVGRKFYDYDEMKHFAIVYKPAEDLKRLYFEFKTVTKPRLSVALFDINPLYIREHLTKYLSEDLERLDEPTSEFLARILKL